MRNRWLAPLLILGMTLFGFGAWSSLPDRIDSHWGASGTADGSMGRTAVVLLMPVLTLGLWAVLLYAPRLDTRRENFEFFTPTYQLIINSIVALMATIHIAVIANGLGWDVPVVRIIIIGIGLLLAILGNELGRLRPNGVAGIRTPWTLSDDEVWRRTHRVGGRLFVVAGLLTALLGLFAPVQAVLIVMIVGMTGVALGLVIYSYMLWRRSPRDTTPAAPRQG